MSLNLVAHEWNSNSGMSSLFSEPPATLYLSLSPFLSVSLSLPGDSPSFAFDSVTLTAEAQAH